MARILYVEDEPALQHAVRVWLGMRGHEVHTAATVAEARDILRATPLDGVLVDIWLGVESGFEVQGWIDDHHPELNTRLAFVTGDLFATRADTPLARLERPVITKPFDFEELDGLIDKWGRVD